MLTDYTDILTHLEASGNVPAGYTIHRSVDSRWMFHAYYIDCIHPDSPKSTMAGISLCHTIEGVLALKTGNYRTWATEDGSEWESEADDGNRYAGPSRLSAAAAAYRAHFNLEVPNGQR